VDAAHALFSGFGANISWPQSWRSGPGKHCALCGKPTGEIQCAGYKPALLNAKNHTVEWPDVPAGTPAACARNAPAGVLELPYREPHGDGTSGTAGQPRPSRFVCRPGARAPSCRIKIDP
jgi:hypothetical protein